MDQSHRDYAVTPEDSISAEGSGEKCLFSLLPIYFHWLNLAGSQLIRKHRKKHSFLQYRVNEWVCVCMCGEGGWGRGTDRGKDLKAKADHHNPRVLRRQGVVAGEACTVSNESRTRWVKVRASEKNLTDLETHRKKMRENDAYEDKKDTMN